MSNDKKKQNPGKIFEKNFIESCKKELGNAYIKRYKDDTSGYAGVKNECDLLVWCGTKLYLLELKTTKGLSLPLNNISEYQINRLQELSLVKNTIAGLVINYRYNKLGENLEKTFFLSIEKVIEFINRKERKSINIEYCKKYGIEIESEKKRVHYRYKVENFIK